jgi:peptide/nickel transport system ATP-binding protein
MHTLNQPTAPAAGTRDDNLLVELEDVKKYFPVSRGFLKRSVSHIKAVDGVSLKIFKGQTHGLVGESGSGKTTLGRTLIRAIDPSGGHMWFADRNQGWIDLAELDASRLRRARQNMKIVYQDPYSSLNPRMTVQQIVGEHLLVSKQAQGKELNRRVEELLELVGLRPEYGRRYPHAFSGGQRQRIAIARALSMRPQLLICDEPVSALDVSVQAQVLKLLHSLQEQFDLSYLFVAHDLSVVENVSEHVSVMYVGQIVESAPKNELYLNPQHPYTEALMSAVPRPDPRAKKERIVLEGELPSPENPPSGCYFHPRCRYVQDVCRTDAPPLLQVSPNHVSRCHFAGQLNLKGAISAQERQAMRTEAASSPESQA